MAEGRLVRDQDRSLRDVAHARRVLRHQQAEDASPHVANVRRPFAQVRVGDPIERPLELLDHVCERGFDVQVLLTDDVHDLIVERVVPDHQGLGGEDVGVAGTDPLGHVLSERHELRLGLAQGDLEAGDLCLDVRRVHRASRDHGLIGAGHDEGGALGDARGDRRAPE